MSDCLSLEACCRSFLLDLALNSAATPGVLACVGWREAWTGCGVKIRVWKTEMNQAKRHLHLNWITFACFCMSGGVLWNEQSRGGSDPVSDEVPHDVSLSVSLSPESSCCVTQRCWGRASPTRSSLFPGCCWRRTTATTRETSQGRRDRALCPR